MATFFLWKGETDEGFNPNQDQKPKLANRPNFLLRPHFSLFPWELAKIKKPCDFLGERCYPIFLSLQKDPSQMQMQQLDENPASYLQQQPQQQLLLPPPVPLMALQQQQPPPLPLPPLPPQPQIQHQFLPLPPPPQQSQEQQQQQHQEHPPPPLQPAFNNAVLFSPFTTDGVWFDPSTQPPPPIQQQQQVMESPTQQQQQQQAPPFAFVAPTVAPSQQQQEETQASTTKIMQGKLSNLWPNIDFLHKPSLLTLSLTRPTSPGQLLRVLLLARPDEGIGRQCQRQHRLGRRRQRRRRRKEAQRRE